MIAREFGGLGTGLPSISEIEWRTQFRRLPGQNKCHKAITQDGQKSGLLFADGEWVRGIGFGGLDRGSAP